MEDWKVIDGPPIRFVPDAKWVEVAAEIRFNATGEVRTHITNEILEAHDESPSPFNWEDNNYSCDCNRRLFFIRAGNEAEPETTPPCSDGQFSVRLYNPVTGNIYYSEFE